VTEVATLVLSVLAPFVWWIAVSLMMQLVTRLFGGEGPLSAILAVIGVGGVPLALGALFQTIGTGLQVVLGVESTAGTVAGLLGGLVALATLVWYVVFVASLARRIGYGESAGSCAVSCAGCLGLIILVAVILVGIGVLVANVYGGVALGYNEWP
jgi:hypothetical protein